MFWRTKTVKFHFWWGAKPRDQKQENGNDSDVISGLKVLGKQISPAFSYFLINNALLYRILANWLAHNKKMTKKYAFCKVPSPEMTSKSFPVPCFLDSRFCTPSEVEFHVFDTSKHRAGKWLSNIFFAMIISTSESKLWKEKLEQINNASAFHFWRWDWKKVAAAGHC